MLRRKRDVSTFFELLQLGRRGEDEKSAIRVTTWTKISGTLGTEQRKKYIPE